MTRSEAVLRIMNVSKNMSHENLLKVLNLCNIIERVENEAALKVTKEMREEQK